MPSEHHPQLCPAISSQLTKSNISSTCPHNMVNFGSLTVEIGWRVWGTPENFNGFHFLASLSSRFDQQHSTEGATYIWLVIIFCTLIFDAKECRRALPLPGCGNMVNFITQIRGRRLCVPYIMRGKISSNFPPQLGDGATLNLCNLKTGCKSKN